MQGEGIFSTASTCRTTQRIVRPRSMRQTNADDVGGRNTLPNVPPKRNRHRYLLIEQMLFSVFFWVRG